MTVSDLSADLNDSLARRQTMVDCQIRTFDVTDQRLIARLLAVPRERFVPEASRDLAYSDTGLAFAPEAPGEDTRYLLPPFVLARLIQGGRVKATDRVLDVACGGGYSTAILAGLAGEVHAVEQGAHRCADLKRRLAGFGLARVDVHEGDLASGLPSRAPFDVILINGAVETNLDPLLAQLEEGGRLLAILRESFDPTGRAAKGLCYEKHGGDIGTRYLFDASAPVLAAFTAPPSFKF